MIQSTYKLSYPFMLLRQERLIKAVVFVRLSTIVSNNQDKTTSHFCMAQADGLYFTH